jgi:hypothetical protein
MVLADAPEAVLLVAVVATVVSVLLFLAILFAEEVMGGWAAPGLGLRLLLLPPLQCSGDGGEADTLVGLYMC